MGPRPRGDSIARTERDIQAEILRELGARPDIRLWRSNAGAARGATGRVVRFGVRGQGDLSGLIGPEGWRLELEVKSAAGRQTKEQRAFQAMVERFGGCYVLARNTAEATEQLEAFLARRRGGR